MWLLIASISLLVVSFILTYINWKIFKLTETLRDISAMVLSENVVIKEETIKIREISQRLLQETKELREAVTLPDKSK
tara:strand:- start:2443 stop:2676 length:234 start_codon:yes stop_codon:yes gene_type:complete